MYLSFGTPEEHYHRLLNLGWYPIYSDSSLPFEEGDVFIIKKNKCRCDTQDPKAKICLKTTPCVIIARAHNVRKLVSLKAYGSFSDKTKSPIEYYIDVDKNHVLKTSTANILMHYSFFKIINNIYEENNCIQGKFR